MVVLCALPIPGTTPNVAAIRSYLRERIAAYKVPRHILFFEEDEIEFTGSQKIQTGPLRTEVQRRLRASHTVIDGFDYGEAEQE